jgi:hypothetical protein
MDTAKDMQKVYAKTPTVDLIKNRNRKSLALRDIQGLHHYWAIKERARLEYLRAQIDDELVRRAETEP